MVYRALVGGNDTNIGYARVSTREQNVALKAVLGAKLKGVRAFLGWHLPPEQTQEFHERLLAVGVPL
jgi:hypothetical protein